MAMTLNGYKTDFIEKHGADWHVSTGGLDEYGRYEKHYVFADGAEMWEVNSPIWENATAETEIHGLKVVLREKVKFMRTEVWNSDDAHSQFFYERW